MKHPSYSTTPRVLALTAALAVGLSGAAQAAVTYGAELVVNGGFEANSNTPDAIGWTFTAAPSGSRAGAVPVDAHAGYNSFFFGSGGNYDQLTQTIATDPFSEYLVQAWVEVDNFFDPDSLANSLLAGFGPSNFFLIQGSPSASYVLMSKTIFVTSASTVLSFQGASKAGNFYVDEVSVRKVIEEIPDAVPEPSAWALMIIGFTGIGTMARRGRRLRQAT
jgi:hypothetical protein